MASGYNCLAYNRFGYVNSCSQPQERNAGGRLRRDWAFLNDYDAELQRRRVRARRRKELEEETEQIQDALDRQIAELLRVQERKDERHQELERVKALARSEEIEAARRYSERVGAAYATAVAKGTIAALDRLDRELRKAREEEELTALLITLEMLN